MAKAQRPGQKTKVDPRGGWDPAAWRRWLPWAALAAVTFLAYVPALRGGFIWDDDDYVTQNQTLRSAGGLRRIWCELGAVPQYYPLVHTTFWLEYRLWGLHPTGYHVANVLLHAANALLVVLVLKRLAVPGAWLAGAVFALHPVHVESVAWITERKNVLSAFFYLASLLVYLRCCGLDQAIGSARSKSPPGMHRRWYAAALALFIAALLSKTVTATLPAAILLIVWWKRGRLTRSDIWPLAPMFALGLAMSTLTGWMERTHVGARGGEFAFSVAERFLIAGRAVWFYAGKLVWPDPLIFIYPRWEIDASQAWQWLFPITAISVPVALWFLRGRLGRGPLAAVLYFGGTLVPALGFVNVYPMVFSFVADHFQYLASLGLITLAAAALTRGWELMTGTATTRQRAAALVLPAAWLLAVATLTWQQGRIYRDQETLWRETLARNPDGWMPNLSLGTVLNKQDQPQEALPYLLRALQISPQNARVHLTLSSVYLKLGQLDPAVAHARRSIAFEPLAATAHYKAAQALEAQGHWDEAISHYRQAVEKDRTSAVVFFRFGQALAHRGQHSEAVEAYRAATGVEPEAAQAHYHLGMAYEELGHNGAAIEAFEQALVHDPRLAEAHNQLGVQLAGRGLTSEAAAHFRQALAEKPDLVDAKLNLAVMTAQQGGLPAALKMFREIVQSHPDNAQAHANLATALRQTGDEAAALAEYREAQRLQPDLIPREPRMTERP